MNFTQSFEEFSSSLKPVDLALYAGIGLVLWVMFKDKLSPVQVLVKAVIDKFKGLANKNPVKLPVISSSENTNEDDFFKMVASWKHTRDLAVQNNCSDAVKVLDQVFPLLCPNKCVELISNKVVSL